MCVLSKGLKCVSLSVYVLWAPGMAQPCYSSLMLVISCPDWIAADRGFLRQREGKDYVCVYVCVSVHASNFWIVCLNRCCGAKCKMIARERREEIDVGAF